MLRAESLVSIRSRRVVKSISDPLPNAAIVEKRTGVRSAASNWCRGWTRGRSVIADGAL